MLAIVLGSVSNRAASDSRSDTCGGGFGRRDRVHRRRRADNSERLTANRPAELSTRERGRPLSTVSLAYGRGIRSGVRMTAADTSAHPSGEREAWNDLL